MRAAETDIDYSQLQRDLAGFLKLMLLQLIGILVLVGVKLI